MLVKWEDGKKCIAEIQVGDRVWSRDEFDPWGRPALKEVLAVFVRVAPIWHLKLHGQTIRTTDEHPFYVLGRDWIPVKHLKVGDLLLTDEGTLERVEGVEDSGKVETVYNFLVADYHTYFVSATERGASIWAHNANDRYFRLQRQEALEEGGLSIGKPVKNPQHHVFPQNARAKAWFRARGVNVDEYTVNLHEGEHQALHGGGNWRLGRTWGREWNNEIMRRLRTAENVQIAAGGGRLTRGQIEAIGRQMMNDYGIGHLPFVPYERGWLPQ
jgi:hypothetical protein